LKSGVTAMAAESFDGCALTERGRDRAAVRHGHAGPRRRDRPALRRRGTLPQDADVSRSFSIAPAPRWP
jgi:hypothetical protein